MTSAIETNQDASAAATCPSCQTAHPSLTMDALENGHGWRCVRCGQRWNASRLAVVAAYASWVAERERKVI